MVDSSRPQSRSGRSTRNNPVPDAAESKLATVSASTSKDNAQITHKTRNKYPAQSNTLLLHGFTRADPDVKPAEPSQPSKLAGHKRTRSAAPTQDDLPRVEFSAQSNNAALENPPKPPTINGISTTVEPAGDVQTQSATLNGDSQAASGSGAGTIATQKALAIPEKKDKDKRTLRSQDGTSRLNSDLAIYFGNFEEVMNDVSTETDPFTAETKIMIVDEPIKVTKTQADLPLRGKTSESKTSVKDSPTKHTRRSSTANGFPTSPIQNSAIAHPLHGLMNGAQSLDLSPITSTYSTAQTQPESDPLADAYYFVAHRRGERKEKQMRNAEREHAQHEKYQLEGILDGLNGPDWLRVMGLTGITEGESKDWKPKRNYFIREVETLLGKFALWREEEKRMKAEKDAKLAAETEGSAEDEEEDAEEEAEQPQDDEQSIDPNSSDIDASAAQQLLEEASNARRRPEGKRQVKLSQKLLEVNTKPPPGPFTSFYPAPHLRAQALGKQRHGGRKEMAFGKPVPDVADADFVMPKELTSPDALRDHARKRRRLKRDTDERKQQAGNAGSNSVSGKGKGR